jgi:hypothetical protein
VEPALSTAETVEAHIEAPFESMENLLMTISPMFRERFQQALYDKLQSVQSQQQLNLQDPLLFDTNIANNNANDIQNNENNNNDTTLIHPNDNNDFDELNHWINNNQ